jgi:hypothetical protein
MSQGNQCIAILNKKKSSFFYKNGEQEGRTGPICWFGMGVGMWGKGLRG